MSNPKEKALGFYKGSCGDTNIKFIGMTIDIALEEQAGQLLNIRNEEFKQIVEQEQARWDWLIRRITTVRGYEMYPEPMLKGLIQEARRE